MTGLPVLEALTNGVRLIHLPAEVPYAAVGLWWQAGSRHEAPEAHGYAHLMEHALFCGAGSRSAGALDEAIDRLGGQVNAETGREWLGLHGTVPAQQQAALGELLADMVLTPRLEPRALNAEKQALAGELTGIGAMPLEAAASRALATLWPNCPAGRPVEGDPDVIRRTDAESLLAWWAERRTGPRLTVTVLGREAADDALLARLDALPAGEPVLDTHPGAGSGGDQPGPATIAGAWAFPVPFSTLPERCHARLAAALIGGTLSSTVTRRLRGAGIYHHECWIESVQGAAACVLTVAGNSPGETHWIEAVEDAIERLVRDGPHFSELETVRRGTMARNALTIMDPPGWALTAADDLLALGRIPSPEETHQGLASTTTATLQATIAHWRERVFAAVDL